MQLQALEHLYQTPASGTCVPLQVTTQLCTQHASCYCVHQLLLLAALLSCLVYETMADANIEMIWQSC